MNKLSVVLSSVRQWDRWFNGSGSAQRSLNPEVLHISVIIPYYTDLGPVAYTAKISLTIINFFFFKTVHNFFFCQLRENVDWSNLIPKSKTLLFPFTTLPLTNFCWLYYCSS